MEYRSLLLTLPLLLFLPFVQACGPGEQPAVEAGPPAAPQEVAGRYDVHGVTTSPDSQEKRDITGMIVLSQQGDAYSARFELKTTYPAEGVDSAADVIGTGSGTIEGGRLVGEAETQLVVSKVPGMDTGFAFVPRIVTARLVSSSVATIAADGSITVEIDNRAQAGSDYRPTRTKLVGQRVAKTLASSRTSE